MATQIGRIILVWCTIQMDPRLGLAKLFEDFFLDKNKYNIGRNLATKGIGCMMEGSHEETPPIHPSIH